ncbi:MAG: response regulator [Desulfobacterales bacterium]
MDKIRILLIEDNPGDARLIEEMLKEADPAGYAVHVFTHLSQGINALLSSSFNIILLDLNLPDSQGLGTLTQLHKSAPESVIIRFLAISCG